MNRTALYMGMGLMLYAPSAAATPLDDLLDRLRVNEAQESQEIQGRLQRFRDTEKDRQALLKEVLSQIKAEEKLSRNMEIAFRAGEKDLIDKRDKLDQLTAHYKEVFATAKLWAVELREQFLQSFSSAQLPDRVALVEPLTQDDYNFSVDDMRVLLYQALNEAYQQGKIVRFPAQITRPDGSSMNAPVTRIGPFTASSGGEFLDPAEDSRQLQVLARQPRSRFGSVAEDFEDSEEAYPLAIIDPSRGAILSLLVSAPDLQERIQQGGIIGYLIIFLGIFGILFALSRGIMLKLHMHRIMAQQENLQQPNSDNALGRIAQVFQDCRADMGPEAQEDRVHEAISEELPKLNWGLNLLRVLAAIAPLLGLLGTVTGMIQTFQDITLFGTGEPRMMAGGISQALVTTALGLTAAIPILLLLTMARAYSMRIRQIVEEQSLGLLTRAAQ